jgi:hypothetical protein
LFRPKIARKNAVISFLKSVRYKVIQSPATITPLSKKASCFLNRIELLKSHSVLTANAIGICLCRTLKHNRISQAFNACSADRSGYVSPPGIHRINIA